MRVKEVSRTHVVLIHETVAQSLGRDVCSAGMVAALIGIGVALDSPAMQWVGAVIAFMIIMSRSVTHHTTHRVTVAEARTLLDKIEAAP